MKAASYIPGLKAVGQAADTMLNAPGQMAQAGVSGFFDEIDKENERTRKEYFKDLEQYSEEAKAKNFSEASDIEKLVQDVHMPTAQNDEMVMAMRNQREAIAKEEWARYVQSKDPYAQMPANLEEAEKIIQKAKDAEMKLTEERVKAAFAADKAAEKEEKAAAKKARAEEKRKQEEERKAKEFRANQLKRQAELTKGLKPLYRGSMEAAKWINGLGEYDKSSQELEQQQVSLLESISKNTENGMVLEAV